MEIFSTERLNIRSWSEDQAEQFFDLTCDKGFTSYPINDYRQKDLTAARLWLQKALDQNRQTGMGKWGVWSKTDATLLGMGGLTPWQLDSEELVDITYRLRESTWGKGLGLELAKGLLNFGFQTLKLDQITATITPDNDASKRLAEKPGFRYDRHIILLGVPTDLYRIYSSK